MSGIAGNNYLNFTNGGAQLGGPYGSPPESDAYGSGGQRPRGPRRPGANTRGGRRPNPNRPRPMTPQWNPLASEDNEQVDELSSLEGQIEGALDELYRLADACGQMKTVASVKENYQVAGEAQDRLSLIQGMMGDLYAQKRQLTMFSSILPAEGGTDGGVGQRRLPAAPMPGVTMPPKIDIPQLDGDPMALPASQLLEKIQEGQQLLQQQGGRMMLEVGLPGFDRQVRSLSDEMVEIGGMDQVNDRIRSLETAFEYASTPENRQRIASQIRHLRAITETMGSSLHQTRQFSA